VSGFRASIPGDQPALVAFLDDATGLNLYLRSRLDTPLDGRGFIYSGEGPIEGFVWLGRGQNLVFAGEEPRFLDELAGFAFRHERSWLMVTGLRDPTSRLLDCYTRISRRRPRLDRIQGFFRQTAGTLPDLAEPRLRPAGQEDLEEATGAAVRMSAEDFDLEPGYIDRDGVRRTMERKIREGRCFVCREDGQLVFKADLAVRGPHGGQVEGVFTAPDFRGRGIASRCLAELGRRLLAECPFLCLHVAERNGPARRAYENAGYRRGAALRLAIMA
jgi:ribosomal protein S18 acetylase RimI-like enzyme